MNPLDDVSGYDPTTDTSGGTAVASAEAQAQPPAVPQQPAAPEPTRFKAEDLAARGIPTYSESTANLSAAAPSTNGAAAPPATPPERDPFANLPEKTAARAMQSGKDQAVKTEAQLLGQKLTAEHADLVAGDHEHTQMTKELMAAVPALQDPKYTGADRNTILGAINDHFNDQYGAPAANDKKGLFSDELSDSAQQLRSSIDKNKADTMQKANDLFDLKEKQKALGDKVAGDQQTRVADLETLIAHNRGQQQSPTDQPTAPLAVATPQVDPQALADAKAGKKAYTIDAQNNVQFDPKRISDSIQQAAADGLIDPQRAEQLKSQLDELQKATDARQKLIDAAGDNPKLKALVSGAIKGSAFAAGFPAGAGVGAAAGAAIPVAGETGIPEIIGSLVGGLITGTIASYGAKKLIDKVGEYNDTIHSLAASSELHPYYDSAGNLLSFGVGAFTRGASQAIGKTVEAGSDNAVAQAIARSYYGSGGGLYNTVQNLAKDASMRAAGGASATTVAKALAFRVGTAAAANAAIDTVVNEGSKAFGLQPQGETWQSAGFAAILGAFLSGHGITFEGYNTPQVADILQRGKVRMDNGIGLGEKLPPDVISKVSADNQEAGRYSQPLTPKEQEVWEAFGRTANQMVNNGQIPADPTKIQTTATQALQGGQPYGLTTMEIQPGETTRGPVGPGEAPIKALTEGGENVRGQQQTTEGQIQQGAPAQQPARGEGAGPQPVRDNVTAGEAAPVAVAPRGNEPAGAARGTTGAVATAEPAVPAAGATVAPAREPTGAVAAATSPATAPATAAAPTAPAAAKTVDEAAHEAATSPQNEKPQPTTPQQTAGNYEKGHFQIGPEGGTKLDVSIENPAGSQRSNLDTRSLEVIADTPAARGGQAAEIINGALESAKSGDYQKAKASLADAANDLRARNYDSIAEKIDKIDKESYAQKLESHYGDFKGTVGADKDRIDVFIKPGTPKNWDGPVYVIDQQTPDGRFDEHKSVIGVKSHEEAIREYQKNYDAAHQNNYGKITEFPDVQTFKQWAESGNKGPAAEAKGVKQVTAVVAKPEEPATFQRSVLVHEIDKNGELVLRQNEATRDLLREYSRDAGLLKQLADCLGK